MTPKPSTPAMYVVTGPMAAGKTTVSDLLARQFEQGVHLEGDLFLRAIKAGRVDMTPSASEEALAQLRLRYQLSTASADAYAQQGFTVVLEDVVAGPMLADYRTMIQTRPCHVVVLLPSLAATQQRAEARAATGYHHFGIEQMYTLFAEETPPVGVWLDTTSMTPEQTVEAILRATGREATRLEISEYDPAWPALFEQLAAPIRRAVAPFDGRVEHVGSTSVPGLAAKPVIDIDVVLPSSDAMSEVIAAVCALGYIYHGDKGIRGREAFLWPADTPPHHLYIVVEGSKPHRDHVDLRDYLRSEPDEASRYADLKRHLAARHADDRQAYTDAKDEFIKEALREARRMPRG